MSHDPRDQHCRSRRPAGVCDCPPDQPNDNYVPLSDVIEALNSARVHPKIVEEIEKRFDRRLATRLLNELREERV